MPQALEKLEKLFYVSCDGRPIGYAYDDHRKAWSQLLKHAHKKGLVKCRIASETYYVNPNRETPAIYEVKWIGVKR